MRGFASASKEKEDSSGSQLEKNPTWEVAELLGHHHLLEVAVAMGTRKTKILPAGSLKGKVMSTGPSVDVCLADGNTELASPVPCGIMELAAGKIHPQVHFCGPHSGPFSLQLAPITAPWPFSNL